MPTESGSWTFEGVTEFNHALRKVVERMTAANSRFVEEGAHLIEAKAKEHAGEGGRHKKGEPTTATVGSGPAVITGSLRRSIRSVITHGIRGSSAMIGPTIIYGRRIELEYDYPYMHPTVHEVQGDLEALARKWYAKAIRV